MSPPRVTVIVLNFNGLDDTRTCLASLAATTYPDYDVLVIDNGSARNEAPDIEAVSGSDRVRVVRSEVNLGFAGGVNAAIRDTKSDYVVLLNNDTIVEPGWLTELVAVAQTHRRIGAVQPKIRALGHPTYFEYGGAAGGYIDRLGFPYCRGRIVLHTEEDRGQYDDQVDLFWGSAACLLLSRAALDETGLLQEDFFFYHEETDLCWRLNNRGYRVVFAPRSVIYHKGSGSSMEIVHEKIFFVHRNALLMAVRNVPASTLVWLLPVRGMIEAASMLYYLATRRPRHAFAVLRADASFLARLPRTLGQRKNTRGNRRATARTMRPFSILWQYFALRRRTYAAVAGGSSHDGALRSDSFLTSGARRED